MSFLFILPSWFVVVTSPCKETVLSQIIRNGKLILLVDVFKNGSSHSERKKN